jgi:hypothetical protein
VKSHHLLTQRVPEPRKKLSGPDGSKRVRISFVSSLIGYNDAKIRIFIGINEFYHWIFWLAQNLFVPLTPKDTKHQNYEEADTDIDDGPDRADK